MAEICDPMSANFDAVEMLCKQRDTRKPVKVLYVGRMGDVNSSAALGKNPKGI